MIEVSRPTTWLALTGFMGVGKSRIGREVARELMLHFIDLDRYIERETGLSIPDIFRHLGEGKFRQLESEAITELIKKDYLVISLGGGTFISEEIRSQLLNRGPTVALWASPETILERVGRKPGSRPILAEPDPSEKIRALLREREATYRLADVHVSTDHRKVHDVVEEIVTKLWEYDKARN